MSQMVHISISFFIGIAIVGFDVLRILVYCNSARKEKRNNTRG